MDSKENKKSDNQSFDNQALEDKSLEELHKQIEKGKRKISRSVVFALSALVAVIALGIAWFVSNTKVSAVGVRISADNPISFELGSTGVRQRAETDFLKGSTGTAQPYNAYIDAETEKRIEEQITLYKGTSNLAWYLNGQQSLTPGSSGILEFYLIPRQEGLTTAKIELNLDGCELNGSNIIKSTNENLKRLLSGHILLFQNLDDTYGYWSWLQPISGTEEDNSAQTGNGYYTFNVSLKDGETFQKDVPYRVTLYWVWPKYFRNYIYTKRSTQEDLFTDKVLTESDKKTEYDEFNKFVNDQKALDTSRLFYNPDNSNTTDLNKGTLDQNMSDTLLNSCSEFYNLADEYIGKNIRYVQIELTVTDGAVKE